MRVRLRLRLRPRDRVRVRVRVRLRFKQAAPNGERPVPNKSNAQRSPTGKSNRVSDREIRDEIGFVVLSPASLLSLLAGDLARADLLDDAWHVFERVDVEE
eukprot:scaffold43728_cov63-Phaeocystis_antarctica.AAC.1